MNKCCRLSMFGIKMARLCSIVVWKYEYIFCCQTKPLLSEHVQCTWYWICNENFESKRKKIIIIIPNNCEHFQKNFSFDIRYPYRMLKYSWSIMHLTSESCIFKKKKDPKGNHFDNNVKHSWTQWMNLKWYADTLTSLVKTFHWKIVVERTLAFLIIIQCLYMAWDCWEHFHHPMMTRQTNISYWLYC